MTTVSQRYATSPEQVSGMSTAELRARYLVSDLFVPGEIRLVYTHHDRIVLGGATPGGAELALEGGAGIGGGGFLDRRELGIVNVGASGVVTADGRAFLVEHGACLYLGRGTDGVTFSDASGSSGARFYLFSAPAHTAYPAALVSPGEGTVRELGDQATSNRRTLTQYIHEGGVTSCQIVMGVTRLHPGSMWNTMPAHTHDRRTECYLYFDLPPDARVVHLLGEPTETRHLLVADREAVISPSWSLHSGVGTASYSFVWAMAGENQAFDDMDAVPVADLR